MEIEKNIPNDFESLANYAPNLAKVKKENCFTVPDAYFDELPEDVLITTITSSFNKQNPFAVPVNYFNDMAVELEASIYAANLSKESELDIPANYFDDLPNEIQAGIITASFPKENPYELPLNYFEKLPLVIQDKINAGERSKVKVLQLDWFSKVQLLTVAASVIIVCLVGINFWNKSTDLIMPSTIVKIETPASNKFDLRIENIDESTLEDMLLGEEGTSSKTIKPESPQLASNEKIVNYLIDNHIDISTLLNELE